MASGRASESSSRRDLVGSNGVGGGRDSPSTMGGSSRRGQAMYQPGTPIGYLAARGTPYEKKYFTKKLGFCCLFLAPPILLVTLAIALVPALYAIADHALHTSQFHVQSSNITSPTNTSFPLTLGAQVKKTGIFPAHLYFRKPIQVYWMSVPTADSPMREIHLGQFNLAHVGAAAGHATVNQATTFYITDEAGFGEFSKFLVSQPEFTWRIKCPEVHAEAFSFFPTYKALPLTKDIVINGLDNFHDLKIIDLQLPGDDPAGGITAVATTTLVNPSPFGIEVGTLELALFYNGLYLGPVSVEGLNLTSGLNTLTLRGRVLPQANNITALNILGDLFTKYINSVTSDVVARGLSARLASGEVVSWLTEGITALESHIPFVPPQPINPIKGITIDYISLVYTPELPYNPTLFSNSLLGTFGLPFGFTLNITQLQTSLNIIDNGALVGTAIGDYSASNTNIQTLSSGQTAGDIDLSLPPTQLTLPNTTLAARQQLIQFQNRFTYSSEAAFGAQGSAKALTMTPLGEILLDGIAFDVTTGLVGLSGLTKYPTIINSVDVTGGTASGVNLAVQLSVVNPSNLNLSTGDAIFQLVNQQVLGTTTLPDLILSPGKNTINATAVFDPNQAPIGLETLNRFISGLDTNLNASGFAGSSAVESLASTLSGIRLNTTLPALKQSLVQAANVTILDTTGTTDGVANSIVQLRNPFSSELTISRITANATSHGIYLAHIDTGLNFPAAGKATTASPNVPLTLNLYPPDLFGLLRALVVQSGQDPVYLDGLVGLAGYTLTPTTSADTTAASRKRSVVVDDEEKPTFSFEDDDDDSMTEQLMDVGVNQGIFADVPDNFLQQDRAEEETDRSSEGPGFVKRGKVIAPAHDSELGKRANVYSGFDLTQYVAKAFSVAEADLTIVSDATIGEYGTTLTFSQQNVPLGTDETLFKLLPPLALPIVQRIVDVSVLNIDRVTITDARPTSFTAQLQGSLTNSGPFDAIVSFPQGLSIYYQGQLLVQSSFPNITLTGDLGASLNVQIEGQIPDVDFFTTFLKSAITDASFEWTIRGEALSVAAIGIDVTGVSIVKNVQLTGLNGLTGQVIINSFDVPSNDPAGGLHLTAVSTINNPAQVGVALSSFGTNINMGTELVGPAAADSAFTLQALAVTSVPLTGRIVAQTTDSGLAALSTIFTRFVHNQNTDLVVSGQYAGPSDVVWLNEGIKALNVIVALPSQDFQVIRLISLNQLALYFTVPSAYSPQTDSSNTTANFFLPFAFPLDITQTAGPFTANYQNADMAVLNIPTSPATTDVEARILTLMFSNVPFAVFSQSHSVFNQFVADFTKSEQITFNLHGTATATTNTAAGVLTISDIPFDLNTNILGLQNLNARPANVSNLDVYHGYPTYLQINVDTTLYNPSDTTVGAGDVTFAVLFQNDVIGQAIIRDILLPPGEVTVPTQINYMPSGATNIASGQLLLENYVQNVTSDTIVMGTTQTTPIESLVQGLSGISLSALIPSLGKLIVTSTQLEVPKDIAQTGVAQVSVTIANPFTASINIINLQAAAIFQGITIGTINDNLGATNDVISAPGHTTTQSQTIPINLNIDPKNLIRFIEAAAASAGVSLGPLPPFFQEVLDLPDTTTTISPYPDDSAPPCNSGRAFDTLGAILALLKPLAVSIPIESTVKLDDYQTGLDFMQAPVPVVTDNTALYLVGPAAAPLIQLIVNQSTLTVTQANATALTDAGFAVSLVGSLATDAPADAYIEFPDGITVNFQGTDIATLMLPPLCASPPDGIPQLSSSGQLVIINEDAFEQFAYYILTEPNFQWYLHAETVNVRALGIAFRNTILQKTIQLDAFNGLPGLVISMFEAPSDQPGRINIATQVPIPSPASLGVELGAATFELFFQGSDIGQVTSEYLFLAPKATTLSTLNGYLKSQVGNTEGLANIGILFSQFLAGQNSTLQIQGVEVISPASGGQPVRWLTAAFKRFQTNVILPGHIYQIIFSITLSDLTVYVLDPTNSYTVIGTNQHTVATFSNPFGFSLQPLSLQPSIVLTYLGVDTASIDLPMVPDEASASRGPTDIQPLSFGFTNASIVAIDHPSFQSFFAKLADTNSGTFGLKGSTAVVARTQIGDPLITGIPFNVTTSLAGINSFNGVATLSPASVDDPTPQYIGIHLNVTLENPSNLTLYTSEVSLPTIYKTRNVVIGRATIAELALLPGSNLVNVLFELMISPFNSSDVQEVIQLFLQPIDFMTENTANQNSIPLQIHGQVNANPAQSPYESLEPALAGIIADTTLAGIATDVAVKIRVYIPASVLIQELGAILGLVPNGTVYVYAYLDAKNDLPSEIDFVQLDTSIADYTDPSAGEYARFELLFGGSNPSYTLPAATSPGNPSVASTTSPEIPNILLSKGLLGSLPLLGHNLNIDNYIRLNLAGPNGAYFIPGLHYIQHNVDTDYYFTLGTGGDNLGIPLDGISDLTGLLNAILAGGGLTAIIDGLSAFDPSNQQGIFQNLTSILGTGTGGIFCSNSLLPALFCQPGASSSTTSAASSSVSLPLTSIIPATVSLPTASATTPAAAVTTTPAAVTSSSTSSASGLLAGITRR